MKILIIEGSQLPPSFIGNLINGLLASGMQVGLLGKLRNKTFVPQDPNGFTRLITDYPSQRMFQLIIDFLFLAVLKPYALKKGVVRATKIRGGYRKKILNSILFAKIYAYDPDIIHFQWAAHLTNYVEFLKVSRYKFVVSLRGTHINVSPILDEKLRNFYNEVFPLMDGIHAVSNAIGLEASKYGAQLRKTKVIYSFVPDRLLTFFEKTNPSRTPVFLLSIGRFHWIKGYIYGIKAVHILKAKGVVVNYTIVAGSDVPEELIFMVHELGLVDQVKFVDKIAYESVPDFMRKYSALLVPSLKEGIANVALEAMAVGLPVISSNGGGMSEVVINRKTGWLVSVANATEITEAVLDYLRMDEDSILKIRENAHKWVSENSRLDKQVLKFVSLYRDVLNG